MSLISKNILLILILSTIQLNAQQAKPYLFQPANSNFYVYNKQGINYFIHQNKFIQWKLHANIRKLATAKRITQPGDDPANLAVAEKMKTILQQLQRESMNDADYRNYLHYYESAVAQDSELLKRIRVLILRSANGILTAEDREYNQSEINQLLSQINMNARIAMFNKMLVIPDLTLNNLGLTNVNVVNNLNNSIPLTDAALKKLRYLRVKAGSKDNILAFRIKSKNYYYLNLQASESKLRDLDMAEEISDFIKNSIILKSQYGIFFQEKK